MVTDNDLGTVRTYCYFLRDKGRSEEHIQRQHDKLIAVWYSSVLFPDR